MPPRPRALAAAALCCALTRARGAPPPLGGDGGAAAAAAAALPVLDQQLGALEARVRRLRGRRRRQPPPGDAAAGGAAAAPSGGPGSPLRGDDLRQPPLRGSLLPRDAGAPPWPADAPGGGGAPALAARGRDAGAPADAHAPGGGGAPAAAARGGGGRGPTPPDGARESSRAPAAHDLPRPPAPPPVLPSRASTPSVAEEHAALLALAEAIKEENRRLRGESVELARGSSGHRGLKLSWSDLDDICYWLAFLILAVQCGMCACSCTRRKDDGIAKDVKRMGAWASWCGHWSAERSQTFWFLLIYWLLIAVLASRALIQLGVVGDFSSFLVEVYIGYLIAGLFLIMINELWVELRKVFHRTFEWCSEEFAKFRESLSKFKSRMDAQAKSVAESLSPDGMERALHRAEDFVAAHSPRMKACC